MRAELLLLMGCVLADAPASAPAEPAGWVVPVDWKRFAPANPPGEKTRAAARLLNTSLRYNLAWAEREHRRSEDGAAYQYANMKEHAIRPPASVAFGTAIALRTATYDEGIVGLPPGEAGARMQRLIRGAVRTHSPPGRGKGWGDAWQSALWASLAGNAAWLTWDDLDDQTRRLAARMVAFEADRFLRAGYEVPYWNGRGGDTKAEENAWNALVLQLAVAMMPRHPHAPRWKRVCDELMISAAATERDWKSNETMMDGRPVKAWLKGYNLREDYALVNHNRLHTDYMVFVANLSWSHVVQGLAGQTVPQAADFNVAQVYRALVARTWPSPPYQAPGGTMYVPGKAEVYYPQGTDWSPYRFDTFYRLDTCVDLLGLDAGLPRRASEWIAIRTKRLLEMQSRHADGRLFAPGEYTTYAGAEQMAVLNFGTALLWNWLHDRDGLGRTGNWNEETGR
ncbi:MAG: hypothetical protein HRF43_17315 [Phycisphaerae bacterium]